MVGRSYVTATVDVDVELGDFDDQDLIDEIEGRGWRVIEDNDYVPEDLTSDEINAIIGVFRDSAPGTLGYEIYEKLRKR